MPNRYSSLGHSVGQYDEWPVLLHLDEADAAYDQWVFQPGMAFCVESYIGEASGCQGVKLEQQIYIGDDGVEILSQFPFDEDLLVREI